MTSPLPTELLIKVASILGRWPGRADRSRALLAGLSVCRAWYQPFKEHLWRTVDLSVFAPERSPGIVRADVTLQDILSDLDNELSNDRLDADASDQEQDEAEDEPAYSSEDRVQRALQLQCSMLAHPESHNLVKTLHVEVQEEIILLGLCSDSVDELHLGTIGCQLYRGELQLSAENPFGKLTRLTCTNIDEELLSLIICGIPLLTDVHLSLVDVSNATLWNHFAYASVPPVETFMVNSECNICQSFIDRVVVPLAPTLVSLTLNVMDDAFADNGDGAGSAESWTHCNNLVFPRLLHLALSRVNLAGAIVLVDKAPALESLWFWECTDNFDEPAIMQRLPPSLVELVWDSTGDSLAFAEQFAECMSNLSWLPRLSELPRVRLFAQLEDDVRVRLTARILQGAKARGIEVTSEETSHILGESVV